MGFIRPAVANHGAGASERIAICAELDCLHALLPPSLLARASLRARQIGVAAESVLIEWGAIDEETYVRQLALWLGFAFEDFADLQRCDCVGRDGWLVQALEKDILAVRRGGELQIVLAPRHRASRQLSEHLASRAGIAPRMRLTTSTRLREFLERVGGETLADHAVDRLRQQQPDLSAAPKRDIGRLRHLRRAAGPLALAIGLIVLPAALPVLAGALLSLAFIGFAAFRIFACLHGNPLRIDRRRVPDASLPVYTVVAALHREAASAAKLVGFLRAFDYPPEKLQILVALEADDHATRAAVARLGPIPNLQIVLAPRTGPRTKPKALNYALPFVRGSYVAVYDAEDEPEPGQLRGALRAFEAAGPGVACLQASLCISNGADSWLARTFTAEYAGQFDIFLQGVSALGLPLPLGGSSNHFDAAVLRRAGAWDPYNVTEDADLGLRLARQGYRAAKFASATKEEAPSAFLPWLRQRTRWMKGWMQTWAVHMQHPRRLWRELGPAGFLALNLLVGGNVLTALAYPCLLFALLWTGAHYAAGYDRLLLQDAGDWLHLVAALSGMLATIGIGLAGLQKRRLLRYGWVLALTPVYWMALSLAAWRALYQFVRAPYVWEKTEHGLARSDHFAGVSLTPLAATRPAIQKYLRRSAAASSGARLMLKGATNSPSLSIR